MSKENFYAVSISAHKLTYFRRKENVHVYGIDNADLTSSNGWEMFTMRC